MYARRKGYFHVGRGSGANSLVAYLLGITDVDPLELDLYFERFINLHRSSPPDFDIDFSWRDREDVTRYIFERYKHVALVGTRKYLSKKRPLNGNWARYLGCLNPKSVLYTELLMTLAVI